MDNQHVREFRKSLESWTDHRFASREQLEDLAMFNLYLVNLSEAGGWQYDGHSYKQKGRFGCLVVKATVKGVPSVVFVSGRDTMVCIHIFLRKLEEGLLEWRKDKYRG